jgi:methyltransferase (TIGR00027 family)
MRFEMALGEHGRNIFVPRSTAEGACALRAAGAHEHDPAIRCPDAMAAGFLGGLNVTTLAKRRVGRWLLLRAADRWRPGAYTYEIMRTKFIDEIVLNEADAGLEELILLGAGLDSRPYRLAHKLGGMRVIEVDHPASQITKRNRLRRLLDYEPTNVTFVPVDFSHDDLGRRLLAVGHEMTAKTLFVWCGVSPYLPENAATEVLSWVGAHQNPGTSITFDVCWAEAIDGSRNYRGASELRKSVARRGEPLRWGVPEGQLDVALERFGLHSERTVGGEAGRCAYLKRSNGKLHSPPYGSWVLVHARCDAAA